MGKGNNKGKGNPHNNNNPQNKVGTNFFEIILREILIDKTIYLDDNTPVFIDDLNYLPKINQVLIKSGQEVYKLSINEDFDFDYDQVNKLFPTIGKITGKIKR